LLGHKKYNQIGLQYKALQWCRYEERKEKANNDDIVTTRVQWPDL